MRIQTIEITNYKAFLGKYTLKVRGKNVFIYGENGSGKSSLYYALKDLFQSSIEDIDFNLLENIFTPEAKRGSTKVRVTLKPNGGRRTSERKYHAGTAGHDHGEAEDTLIRDANKLKSFLTYKHLLVIHCLKKGDTINLFDLLVNGVLRHFRFSLTGDKEFGELWSELNSEIKRPTDRTYSLSQKRPRINSLIKQFNNAFGELFKESSPEYILRHTSPILDTFHHNLQINLTFPQIRPSDDYFHLEDARVDITVTYAGKEIVDPQIFLNEARLSAIAISIYLGMIKRHPQGIDYKILFLDDIFIGLDISNRLPLLKILDEHFPDYQIFLTTYDKPWFEYAKGYLDDRTGWKTMEFYTQRNHRGYELPQVFDNENLIGKAEMHLADNDYKAAAVYTRSAFEKELKDYCNRKRKKVAFHIQQKRYSSQDFWTATKGDLEAPMIIAVERYRDLVLNAFSHYNTEKHEIGTELRDAINTIKTLKTALRN